jgi:hypothetical protein
MRSIAAGEGEGSQPEKNVALLNTLTEKKTVSRLPMSNNIMQESAKSRHGFT